MSKDFYYNIIPNESQNDYVCMVNIHGKEYDYENIEYTNTIVDSQKTKRIVDNETGELLLEKTSNCISDNNSMIHSYLKTSDVAKNKNMPRKKVEANGRHIVDIYKQHSDFLQVSTGSSHDKRGIITADIDIRRPDNIKTHRQTKKFVTDYLKKKFEMTSALGFPMPTSYQIHLTNGHVQVFWVLEKEITIKKIACKEVFDHGEKRLEYFLANTDVWNPYMKVLRFMNILYGGDPAFTGWQIKNMFLTDKIFKHSFQTIWNDNGTWSETEPQKIKKHKFNSLLDIVNSFVSNPKDEKFNIMSDLMEGFGTAKNVFREIVCNELMMTQNEKSRFGLDPNTITTNKSTHADLNYGRNQFVRMKVFEVVRAYKNHISSEKCKTIVYELLKTALKKYGVLKGTKNKGAYTKKDFDRDFNSTYRYATLTYDKNKCHYNGYTPEQRERAECQKRTKKNARLSTLLVLLEEHPELIPDTNANSKKLIEFFAEYDIDIKSVNTISNYKSQLGISKKQTKLSPKNYKKADIGYDERMARIQELNSLYSKLDKSKISDSKNKTWKNRLKNLDTSQIDPQYKCRKRYSLKYISNAIDTKKQIESISILDYYIDNPKPVYKAHTLILRI